MTIKLSRCPGANPEDAFKLALENIRGWHSSKGEVPQVRNLITPRAVRRLNTVAATQYDDNFGVARFYGGMIHRFPTATFDVIDGATKASRSTSRELADFLLVAVFTEANEHGSHEVKSRRACLIQAKLDCSSSGAQVFNLEPTTQDIPKKTDEEQFYLLNQWPDFGLSCAKPEKQFNLRALDTPNRSLAKYCFLWDEPTAKTAKLPPSWQSSWQCANPEPRATAETALGALLVKMIDSDTGYGKEFEAAVPGNDWDSLMNTLTAECRMSEWSKESKLADPAGVSFVDEICAFSTLQQHARSLCNDPWQAQVFPPYGYSSMSRALGLQGSGDPGLPVLVVAVSSFTRREAQGDSEWSPRLAFRDALSKLGYP